MCIVPVLLKLRICFFLVESQGVPGDEVLLHPELYSHAEQIPWLKNLPYKNQIVSFRSQTSVYMYGHKRPVPETIFLHRS